MKDIYIVGDFNAAQEFILLSPNAKTPYMAKGRKEGEAFLNTFKNKAHVYTAREDGLALLVQAKNADSEPPVNMTLTSEQLASLQF